MLRVFDNVEERFDADERSDDYGPARDVNEGNGCSVNILKNKLVEVNATTIAAIALAMVMPVAVIALMGSDVIDIFMNHEHGVKGMSAVVVLAVIGTAAALVVFNALIKWTDALTASSVTLSLIHI